ncbi:MAG: zinc ribbon domain-containing protein [Desulfovibrio sp.]|jgi:putative FmdB family regulatory protein|nr:zinc ribbon domain-containing protein [Desulfovibrio sp.]
MPIYEYRCASCHRIFEEWSRQVEEDSVPRSCPLCGCEARRLISHTSFALKGQGWYATDYGSLKGKKEGEAAASTSPLPPPAPPTPAEAAALSAPPAPVSSGNANASAS